MPHFIAIQSGLHANAGFVRKDNFSFALQDTIVPILWEELSHVIPYLPLCFVKNNTESNDQGDFQLVALQGLQAKQNLLLHPLNKKWLLGYVPAFYRGYPFALIKDTEKDKQVLCFDVESELFRDELVDEVVPFFENGQPSQTIKNTLQFLEMTQKSQALTKHAVDQLAASGVLTEWNITLKTEDDKTIPLKGLYKVDEKKLQNLSPEILAALAKKGVLSLAYAQLLSEHQLKNLQRLLQIHNQVDQVPEELDLDKLFGEDDDSLKF